MGKRFNLRSYIRFSLVAGAAGIISGDIYEVLRKARARVYAKPSEDLGGEPGAVGSFVISFPKPTKNGDLSKLLASLWETDRLLRHQGMRLDIPNTDDVTSKRFVVVEVLFNHHHQKQGTIADDDDGDRFSDGSEEVARIFDDDNDDDSDDDDDDNLDDGPNQTRTRVDGQTKPVDPYASWPC